MLGLIALSDTDSDLYIGCYKDHWGTRAMDLYIGESSDRTIENCIAACKEKRKAYAGLQVRMNCVVCEQ